jgi:hypothetical protein
MSVRVLVQAIRFGALVANLILVAVRDRRDDRGFVLGLFLE